MAWANNSLFNQLSELPESALEFSAWNPEWTVGIIANHIVISQGRLIARIKKEKYPAETLFPLNSLGMKDLAAQSLENDTELTTLIDLPEELLTFGRFEKTVQFSNTAVIVQSVHHATEHRAQIADIMAFNKMDVINLESLDHWSFERTQLRKDAPEA